MGLKGDLLDCRVWWSGVLYEIFRVAFPTGVQTSDIDNVGYIPVRNPSALALFFLALIEFVFS